MIPKPIKTCLAIILSSIASNSYVATAAPVEKIGEFPPLTGVSRCAVVQKTNKVVMGGEFTYGSWTDIIRMSSTFYYNGNGTVEAGTTTNGYVEGMAVQNDDKILVWGEFSNVGGTTVNRFARLNSDLSLDTSFVPDPNYGIKSIAVQPDGKLIVCGDFTQIAGISVAKIARLNSDGTLDTTFTSPTLNYNCSMCLVLPDGKILLAGSFNLINGSTNKYCCARLNSDGSLDSTFHQTYFNSHINSMTLLKDGKILLAGVKTNSYPSFQQLVARFNADGSQDTSFSPIGLVPKFLGERVDGKLIWATEGQVGLLNADGTTEISVTTWATSYDSYGTHYEGGITSAVQIADGRLALTGWYQGSYYDESTSNTIGFHASQPIVSLQDDSEFTDLKALDGATRLVWMRSGRMLEGWQVEFESSSGSTWTPLGAGTRITGGWELSGLSPLASNLKIRATMRTANSPTHSTLISSNEVYLRQDIEVRESAPSPYPYYPYNQQVAHIASGTTQKTYTIYNRGAYDLTVSNIAISGTHSADYSMSSVSLPLVIPAYQSTPVTVTFDPSAVGERNGTLVITSDDADQAVTNIPMTGIGINSDLRVYGNTYLISHGDTSASTSDDTHFGEVYANSPVQKTFEMRNIATSDLVITSATSSNPNFTCSMGPGSVVPYNQKRDLIITFTPDLPYGTETATISISSDDGSKNPYTFVVQATEINPTLRVKGNGVVIAKGDTTPTLSDHTEFGSVKAMDNNSIVRTFTLENIGASGDLYVSAISSTSSGFSVNPYGYFIAPGTSTTFQVTFDPSIASNDTSVISIVSDSIGGSPHNFTVHGTGLRPQLTVKGNGFSIANDDTTPSLGDHTDFGYVQTGGTMTTEFVLQNTGTGDLWLHAGSFGVTAGSGMTESFTSTLPIMISPGSSVTWPITFSPSSAVLTQAITRMDWSEDSYYNFPTPSHSFTVQGTGVVAGSLASGHTPTTGDGTINAAAVQSDGKIVIGGTFTTINSTARQKIARLNADGTLDTSFNPGATTITAVEALLVQPDGKIVVGGTFTNIASASPARVNLARLNSDGTIDSSFTATCTGGAVRSICRQSDGALIVGGQFTTVAGLARARLARITTSSTLDTTFLPSITNGIVYSAVVQDDGQVVVGGTFTAPRSGLARFDSSGNHDTTFGGNVGTVGATVYTVALQQDGKIVIGGNMLAGTRYRIARYLSTGSPDTGFTPPTTSSTLIVQSAALQADGKIIIGGTFTGLTGATTRRYLARLNANGTLDSYDAAFATTTSGNVNVALPLLNGRVFVGGIFTPPSLTARRGALLENGAAAEELVKVGSDIHWYRDGALPEVTNVSFESWNGSSWTAHTGTLSQVSGGGGWQLTSVSPALPSSGKLRAKACYGANGSSSWFTSQESQY